MQRKRKMKAREGKRKIEEGKGGDREGKRRGGGGFDGVSLDKQTTDFMMNGKEKVSGNYKGNYDVVWEAKY